MQHASGQANRVPRSHPPLLLRYVFRGAAERVSFADCAAPPAQPLAGHEAAEEWVGGGALASVDCCNQLAALLLPLLQDPAVCQELGSSAAYRLTAACSWGCGEEAAAILSTGRQAAEAPGLEPSSSGWETFIQQAERALLTACLVTDVGLSASGAEPPQDAKAALATLCQPDRLRHLLDAAVEVLLAADKASGAGGQLCMPAVVVEWLAAPQIQCALACAGAHMEQLHSPALSSCTLPSPVHRFGQAERLGLGPTGTLHNQHHLPC